MRKRNPEVACALCSGSPPFHFFTFHSTIAIIRPRHSSSNVAWKNARHPHRGALFFVSSLFHPLSLICSVLILSLHETNTQKLINIFSQDQVFLFSGGGAQEPAEKYWRWLWGWVFAGIGLFISVVLFFFKDPITINVKIDQTGTKIVVNGDKGLKNLCSQRHL